MAGRLGVLGESRRLRRKQVWKGKGLKLAPEGMGSCCVEENDPDGSSQSVVQTPQVLKTRPGGL